MNIITNDLSLPEIESKEIWKCLHRDNLATFNRNSLVIFNYLMDSYDNKEFLNEFFVSNFDFSKYLYQFSLLINLYSLKRYEVIASLPSTTIGRRIVREYIEPFLFKIKTEYDFNYCISEVFNDIEEALDGNTPKFIENYPERCKKLTNNPQRSSRIPCDYFDR